MLLVATYEKGHDFMREAKGLGCRVLLLTDEGLRDADWPRESVDETFYLPRDIDRHALLKGISYLARKESVDRVVALDDFDVEIAARSASTCASPGMGETTARYFRDKLAMRVKARAGGIPVPEFVHVLNDAAIDRYLDTVPVAVDSQAPIAGVRDRHAEADHARRGAWAAIEALGDERSFYLLERFVAGDVYHLDGIVGSRALVFAECHKYGDTPFNVAQGGGVFSTRTIRGETPEAIRPPDARQQVVETLGLVRGVTHTEFIRSRADGRLYFLETSARVGGAHIVDVVEAATGVNLWREWAKIEVAGEDGRYEAPLGRREYAGLVLSLARQEHPDMSSYADPEIVMHVDKRHHAGLVLAGSDPGRIASLIDSYATRFAQDFMATLPAPDRPTS